VRVEWKVLPEDEIYCCRGAGIIRASAEVIRLHLVQIDLRQFWDPMVNSSQKNEPNTAED